jgi:hypothetical protein
MPEYIDVLEKSITFPTGTRIPERGNGYLKQPIPAQVVLTKDGFIISSAILDEEAYGNTYPQAVFEFLTSLYDRLQSLSRRENKLSSEDKAVLSRLRDALQI